MKQNVGTSRKWCTKPSKRITMQQYNAQTDKIIKSDLPVHEILIKLLEYASAVEVVDGKT